MRAGAKTRTSIAKASTRDREISGLRDMGVSRAKIAESYGISVYAVSAAVKRVQDADYDARVLAATKGSA